MTGYVYFIEAGDFVKIGYTTSMTIRLSALQVGCPYTMRLRCKVPGTKADEKWLHDIFCEEACRGEWFHFSGAIKKAIEILENCNCVSDLPDKVFDLVQAT